jgi:hypothetical protein
MKAKNFFHQNIENTNEVCLRLVFPTLRGFCLTLFSQGIKIEASFHSKVCNLDEQHLYEDCWNGMWKCNLANPKQWLHISTILLSFSIQKNTTNKSQITIPTTYASRAKINLNATNASTNL